MKKIVFLIRSLNVGGAERQLLTLLNSLDRDRFESVVVTFYSEGNLLPEFNTRNIPVISASKKNRWDVISFLYRLIKIIQNEKPDMVVSYLVAANLLAIFLRRLFKPAKIIISIRHSFLRKEDYDWLAALLYTLENRIARWSDLVVLNSFTGARLAADRGVPKEKMVVIPNGIDTHRFFPDLDLRKTQRNSMGIPSDAMVAGLIGRLDPVKDHASFIQAAHLLKDDLPSMQFLIAGDGPEDYRQQLILKIQELDLKDRFLLIPAAVDPLPIYNALDICVSSSVGEGFSNVIAEAMACEIPCVVTNVGDSADIIGQTGEVIPVSDATKLAQALLKLAKLGKPERQLLGKAARERIVREFSVDKMVHSTMQEFEKLG